MKTLLDDVMTEIKKSKYPFQNKSDFEYYEEIVDIGFGKDDEVRWIKLPEYTVQFPIAGTKLLHQSFDKIKNYKDSGKILVVFPDWTEYSVREYDYYDKASKHKAMTSAIKLII